MRFRTGKLALISLLAFQATTNAETLSATFIDETGEANRVGDIRSGRIVLQAGQVTLEYESVPGEEFFNNGEFMLWGGSFLNLSDVPYPLVGTGFRSGRLPAPSRELIQSVVLLINDGENLIPRTIGWSPGDRIVVHKAYDFEARDMQVPETLRPFHGWLFGVYHTLGFGFGEEFKTPLSSFAVLSRHPRWTLFGNIDRDDTGEMSEGVLYFVNRLLFTGVVATADGPRVSALENLFDSESSPAQDSYRLIVETSAGQTGQTADRRGYLGRVGFPARTYTGNTGGPFVDFFVEPRDLTDARIRLKSSEWSDTGLVEARLVVEDNSGSRLATTSVQLDGNVLDWRPRFSDFTDLATGPAFDASQVVDIWLELFSASPEIEIMPATRTMIDRIEVEVRQPKVRLLVDDPLLRYGESTEVTWRSYDAESCTGSGLLPESLANDGSIIIENAGVASISCTSANTQAAVATDTVTVHRPVKTVVFTDPEEDTLRGLGNGDVVRMTLDIAEDGWYQMTVNASETAPFTEGTLSSVVRFYNGDVLPYDVDNAVLFGGTSAPLDDGVRFFYPTASTSKLVLSGRAPQLSQWSAGDRIALDSSVFGIPDGDDRERTSWIGGGRPDLDIDRDFFTTGLSSEIVRLARFDDVPSDHWAFTFIERLAASGITTGCGGNDYCPDDPISRAQMAVFLERGMRGSDYLPPAATGNVFLDVEVNDFAAAYIEQLFADGVTGGCGTSRYCPADDVSRAQMAVFLLRARHGADYVPPAPVGAFADVDLPYWAAAWIERLAAEGITSGCGADNYCPEDAVSRAQMAVFLVRAFGL